MSRVIDLSQPLSRESQLHPFFPPTQILRHIQHTDAEPGRPSFSAEIIITSNHAATHVDAFGHYQPGGAAIAEMPRIEAAPTPAQERRRSLFFRDFGWVECPVHERSSLERGRRLNGPAVIEQMDTTVIVAPDFAAEIDQFSNIILTPKAQN